MKIILDDGTIFEIDGDSTSTELIDKIIRIMKYMTFSDITIAKGLIQNLYDMSYNEIKEMIKELCEEI